MTGQGRWCCTNSPTVLYSVLENFIKTHVSYEIKQDLDLDAHRRSGQNIGTSSMEATARNLKYGDVVKEEWCRSRFRKCGENWATIILAWTTPQKTGFPIYLSFYSSLHAPIYTTKLFLVGLIHFLLSFEVPIHRSFMHLLRQLGLTTCIISLLLLKCYDLNLEKEYSMFWLQVICISEWPWGVWKLFYVRGNNCYCKMAYLLTVSLSMSLLIGAYSSIALSEVSRQFCSTMGMNIH